MRLLTIFLISKKRQSMQKKIQIFNILDSEKLKGMQLAYSHQVYVREGTSPSMSAHPQTTSFYPKKKEEYEEKKLFFAKYEKNNLAKKNAGNRFHHKNNKIVSCIGHQILLELI